MVLSSYDTLMSILGDGSPSLNHKQENTMVILSIISAQRKT
jgi:hypothetical protein